MHCLSYKNILNLGTLHLHHLALPPPESFNGVGTRQLFPAAEDKRVDQACDCQNTSDDGTGSTFGEEVSNFAESGIGKD